MDKIYVDTVRLSLETAPHVFHSNRFAIKGGTALNFFVMDMPRLSVDIDAVYTDHRPIREDAMNEVARTLKEIKKRLYDIGINSEFFRTESGEEAKVHVRRGNSQVKREVNFVFRGTVLPTQERNRAETTREQFATNLLLPLLAESALYGSKLVTTTRK